MPEQNGCHFADDIFKRIFLISYFDWIFTEHVPKGPTYDE